LIGILLTSSYRLLCQVGSITKILLTLTKALICKPGLLLHVGRSRRHGLPNVLTGRLIVRSTLLLGLTDTLQCRLINGVRLTLTSPGGINTLTLQVLPLLDGLICRPLKSINVANASFLGRR
jgi:hypothetical protein